jgi:hypothetical protein
MYFIILHDNKETMSIYNPPTEVTPIFNPSYWIPDTTGLTQSEADALYLSIFGGQIIPQTESFAGGLETNTIEPFGTASEVLTFSTTGQTNFSGSVNVPTGSSFRVNNVNLIPSQTGQSGKYLATDGTATVWQTADALPSQTGNSGRYLGTNGSIASWSFVPNEIPSQTGESGKYLTTNGTALSWGTVNFSPAGSNTQLQFNSAGAFGASANLVFNNVTNVLSTNGIVANTLSLNSIANTTTANILFYNSTSKVVTFGAVPSSSVPIENTSTNATFFPAIVSTSSGNLSTVNVDTNYTFNPSTNVLTVPVVSASLSGSATCNLNRNAILTGLNADPNHGLRQSSNTTLWNGTDYNGPVLHGNTNVVIGTKNGSTERVGMIVDANNKTTTFGRNDFAFATTGRFVEIDANSVNSSFIDFHSLDGGGSDFDARIISSGGNAVTSGQGTLSIQANQCRFGTTNVCFGTTSQPPSLSQIDSNNDALRFFDGRFLKFPSINNRPCIGPLRGTITSGSTFDVALSGIYNQNGILLIGIVGGTTNWSFATGWNIPLLSQASPLTITGTVPSISAFYANGHNNIRFGSLFPHTNWRYVIWLLGMDGDIFN